MEIPKQQLVSAKPRDRLKIFQLVSVNHRDKLKIFLRRKNHFSVKIDFSARTFLKRKIECST